MNTPFFIDGLGRRFTVVDPAGDCAESFHLCAEIPATPAVQAALVERAASLTAFEHPAFQRVRRIEQHGTPQRPSLAVVADAADGVRLSDLLRTSERRSVDRDLDAALHLLLHVTAAVAALHRHSPEAAHGAIGPERLVVRSNGGLVLVEHVLGGALETLQFSRLQLWGLFRVAVPAAASTVRFDQQADALQLGVLALALLLGRVLRREEFPHGVPAVLEEAMAPDPARNYPGCPRPIRGWIGRALQLDARTAFQSAVDAERALLAALREDGACRPSPAAVQRFLATCSFESLASVLPTEPRRLPQPGAVVAVGSLERGSGAHRTSRPQPPADRWPPDVLAEFASAREDVAEEACSLPPSPGAGVPQITGASSRAGRDHHVRPVRPHGNWLSRLLPR